MRYYNLATKEVVEEEDAYIYACEHARREALEDEDEFTDEEFTEWFFSGNWVKESDEDGELF